VQVGRGMASPSAKNKRHGVHVQANPSNMRVGIESSSSSQGGDARRKKVLLPLLPPLYPLLCTPMQNQYITGHHSAPQAGVHHSIFHKPLSDFLLSLSLSQTRSPCPPCGTSTRTVTPTNGTGRLSFYCYIYCHLCRYLYCLPPLPIYPTLSLALTLFSFNALMYHTPCTMKHESQGADQRRKGNA
jgi:hypothetical protein